MADEYIRKQDAVDLVNKISNLDLKAKGGICVSLANLQKADVVQVVVGKWEYTRHYWKRYRKCSVCSAERKDDRSTGWNFCPYCGAKMDKE